MKTKINQIPLIGPRGRKELLKRINELEAQVVQHEYIRIEIDDIEGLTEEERLKIIDAHERGVIFDVIIVFAGGDILLRVVADLIGSQDKIVVYSEQKQGLIEIDVSLE